VQSLKQGNLLRARGSREDYICMQFENEMKTVLASYLHISAEGGDKVVNMK